MDEEEGCSYNHPALHYRVKDTDAANGKAKGLPLSLHI